MPDLARELFRLGEAMFAPYAEIGEPTGDIVPLKVQGAALPRGQLGHGVAPVGTVFRPVRVFYNPDDTVLNIQKVPFSYLVVSSREDAETRATLVRGVADPLTKRYPRKNKLVALGVRPGAFPTRFRFVQQKEQTPAAGYVLTARPAPDGPSRVVATTDREGRVSIPRGFADGLVIVRLIAGRSEPLREVPIMPGESDEELTIPIDPRAQAVRLETQLDALRDDIVDVVAVRNRLERKMKAREQGDDWAGVEEVLTEFRKLPPRDGFVKRLERLTEDAQKQEERTRSVVLTKTARAQLTETRALIDRYLDDELYRAYEDAVLRARSATPAARPRRKPRRRRPPGSPHPSYSRRPQPSPPRRRLTPRRRPRRRRRGSRLSDRASVRISRPPPIPCSESTSSRCARLPRRPGVEPAEELGELRPAAEEPLEGGGREAVDLAVPGRDHPDELEHLLELLAGVLLGRAARLGLARRSAPAGRSSGPSRAASARP